MDTRSEYVLKLLHKKTFINQWINGKYKEKPLIIYGDAGIGKTSFTEEALVENFNAFMAAIVKAKPTGSKGLYVKRATLSSTMGPGVRLNMTSLSG